jgi:hypothetical protein
MSDPFLPLERKEGITYEILKLLADYNHPVVISTKGDLFRDDKYLDLLSRGRFILQLSMTSVRDALMRDIDVGTPGPSKLLLAGSEAAQAGVSVACRIQPLIPGLEKEAADVISACAQTGFRHVAVEHLKLPVERWQAITHLSDVLGFDLRSFYRESGAERVGREWVLPAELRLPTMLELRDLTHASGMTFGAADTDLLLLSDGRACCSGIDLLHKSFGSFFTYTYTEACRQGLGGEIIRMTRLDEEWRPIGTVSRFVNSSSRLPTSSGAGAGIDDYIRRNWNGSRNGPSPQTLYGVEETGDADDRGFAFYRMNDRVRRLINRSD